MWDRDSSASASSFARARRLHDQRSGGWTVAIIDKCIGSLRWHLEEEEKQVEESLAVESSPPLSTSATSDPPPTTNYRAEFFNRYVLEYACRAEMFSQSSSFQLQFCPYIGSKLSHATHLKT